MTTEDLKTRLQAELPELLKQDTGFRRWLEQLIRETAVTPESFDARFDRILEEFATDRAEQRRRWDEQNRKWDEQNRKWDEQNRKWDEQNRKWEEWIQEFKIYREEQERRWEAQNHINSELIAEIRQTRSRQEQGIGALGARWGIASEESFRAALKGILEQSFGVEVLHINDFDDEGMVFGVPDQVEIDVIIRNGELILCELKSSMSKSDMYIFDRKVRYYEQRHQRQAQRKIVISPMVISTARAVAERLGIEVFTYAEDATGL
jgi:hypothetical protein